VLSGTFVGFSLGLIGGGGSVLATPLLLYVVGLGNAHVAIGTGAFAVAVNAFANLMGHARAGHVRWGPALAFAAAGIVGALVGSTLGKAFDGGRLLFLFALLMIAVGVLMLRRRPVRPGAAAANGMVRITWKLLATGLLVGLLSGFFGIGGGFLIVPGLMFATGMPMLNAVGTSLLSVGAFGLATAVNYAWSGLVDWMIAGEYILGGVFGGWLGMQLAVRLAAQRDMLRWVFAGVVFAVAAYMMYRNAVAFFP
jgi:uncharacterized membrane protein YfcA